MHRHHHHGPRYGHPWHPFHSAIWLIGLGFLALHGWWWPGILVLVGISMIAGGIFRDMPGEFPEEKHPAPPPAPVPPVPPAPAPAPVFSYQTPPAQTHRADLLPATCSHCGGPIRSHEVKWTGPRSAACPFCGSTLSMKKD